MLHLQAKNGLEPVTHSSAYLMRTPGLVAFIEVLEGQIMIITVLTVTVFYLRVLSRVFRCSRHVGFHGAADAIPGKKEIKRNSTHNHDVRYDLDTSFDHSTHIFVPNLVTLSPNISKEPSRRAEA